MEQRVKSRAGRKIRKRSLLLERTASALGLLALVIAGLTGKARADRQKREHRPLLLGGSVEVHRPQVRLDPLLPPGERIRAKEVAELPEAHCSLRRPVCVLGPEGKQSTSALTQLERAYELLTRGAGLSGNWGASSGPDALSWSPSELPLRVHVRPAPSRGFDRGAPHCVGGEPEPAVALRCVVEATLAVRSPASASWLRRGLAHLVTSTWLPSPPPEPAWLDAQQRPEEGVLLPAEDDRSSLFFEYLTKFSAPQTPLVGPLSAFLIAATRTPAGALRYEAEPDLLDSLRVNLEGDRNRFARMMDDFAVYRFARGGEIGHPPRLAWEVPLDSLPRTLVLQEPLLPGGSAYVRVRLDGRPEGYVALRTYCETPVSYVWSVLLLDEDDRILRHVPVPFLEQVSHVKARIGQLEDAASLLAVGTNLGGVDLAHPFDPDHGPHEHHGCRVTFNRISPTGADVARTTK